MSTAKRRPDKPQDPEWLVQLRLDVAELLEPRELHTWVVPDKRGIRNVADPELARHRAGGFAWPPPDETAAATHQPLLVQLELLRDGHAAAGAGRTGRAAPASRLPAGHDVADLVVDITTGVADLRWQLLRALGRQEETAHYATRTIIALGWANPAAPALLTARDDLELKKALANHGMPDRIDTVDVRGPFAGYTEPSAADLFGDVLRLVVDAPGKLQASACKQVHSWVLAARLALSYSAPMLGLDMRCPYCLEQNLITRSDASGDVFCTTADCVDGNGQQPRWPRSSWGILLTNGETA